METNGTPPLPPENETVVAPVAAPEMPYGPAPQVTTPATAHGRIGLIVAFVVVLALLAGAAAGLAGGYVAYRWLPSEQVQRVELLGDTTEEVVAAAAAVALPSVVNVDVIGSATDSSELPPDHPGVPLQGEGSGVAYAEAPDGGTYIITNNHVIDGAGTIMVTDSTGERYPAELVGGDAESDIAVVKVAARIPTVGIGNSESLVVGQLAIAIGSPFGLEHSVTSGVISALHRPLTDFGGDDGRYPYVDSIQTDAAINPGNSGGALVDRSGLLIGIPSAIYSNTGVSDGVGLAIPIRTAARAADELIEKGRVDTPFLGVLGQTVNAALAEQESLPVQEGAWVAEVTPGTEAEKAGVRPGDVIVALDDVRIRSMDDLILAVRRQSVGDQVTLKLWRDGAEMTVEMKIGVKPQSLSTN
jgi:serine protease Do